MASIFDVAAYLLPKIPKPVTAMKMQKLLYYCQAWSLIWDDEPLFDACFEAWANGPVAPAYWSGHQGEYQITSEPKGNATKLVKRERETIDAIIKAYGDKTPRWLSEQTHREEPWIKARAGLSEGERGNRNISHGSMIGFYGSR